MSDEKNVVQTTEDNSQDLKRGIAEWAISLVYF